MKRLSLRFGKKKTWLPPELFSLTLWCRTIMFAGHETTAKTVSFSMRFDSRFILTGPR